MTMTMTTKTTTSTLQRVLPLCCCFFLLSLWASSSSHHRVVGVAAFSAQPSSTSTTANTLCINVKERTPRNILGLQEWAKSTAVQIATHPGFRLEADPVDEQDYSVSTTKPLTAGEVVLTVPAAVILSSNSLLDGLSPAQLQGLQQAEAYLMQQQQFRQETTVEDDTTAAAAAASTTTQNPIPLFRLVVLLLWHYERGDASPYFDYLDALPRRFYNGVVMTSACFDCLPPYVKYLCQQERQTSLLFQQAMVQYLAVSADEGCFLSQSTVMNTELLDWAYCVAVTRSWEIHPEVRVMVPMADMFNHAGTTEQVNVAMEFDQDNNCVAYATQTISPGTPLCLCYGDPTNPSPFFATYGFLDKSSPATFCKIMHLQAEMAELQLDFSNLLFYKETGDISMEVWDLILYALLKQQYLQEQAEQQQVGADNDNELNVHGFYEAYMANDVDTKNYYHQQYFPYTKQALADHVNGLLEELEHLAELAKTKDIAKHPRLSLIKQHNEFVKSTFLKVKANLDAM